MLTLHRSKRIVVCISLVLVVLLATSCAPAVTPTPTLPPAATPTPSPTAPPAAVATPTPLEEEIPTSTPEVAPEEALYLPEVPRITCEELKALMDEGTDLVLVDTRIDFSFESEHIQGAINIPDTLTEEMIEAKLLELPKDKLIVLYCD